MIRKIEEKQIKEDKVLTSSHEVRVDWIEVHGEKVGAKIFVDGKLVCKANFGGPGVDNAKVYNVEDFVDAFLDLYQMV